MNYLSYYFNRVVSWDLVLKDPYQRQFSYSKLLIYCRIYSTLSIRNESDIKVAKFLIFLNQMLGNNFINVGLKKSFVKEKGLATIRKVFCSTIIRNKINLFYILENFRSFIFENIMRKRIPVGVYLIPDKGILRFMVKDIGELGFFNAKYDFFGWQDYCFIDFFFRNMDLIRFNLLLSYLNFNLVK